MNHVEIRSIARTLPAGACSSWLVPVDRVRPGAADPEAEPADEHDSSTGLARKTVLVVDDEQGLLEVMRFALEGEGFEVETARNGREALERLRTGRPPSLVLLDLMMPVMSGWEFLDEVAKLPSLDPSFDPPPIVVLTAAGSMGVPGAAEVVRKPYDLGVLLEAVERHLRGGE